MINVGVDLEENFLKAIIPCLKNIFSSIAFDIELDGSYGSLEKNCMSTT